MMKLFGFSTKEKVSVDKLAKLYSHTLFEVVDQGFLEIIGFVNDNRKFKESPDLQKEDTKWFLMVVFAANNHRLAEFFPDNVVDKMRETCTQEIIRILGEEEEVIRDVIVDYEVFFEEQLLQSSRLEKAMARSIFIKYNLNDYQGKLLKNQNEPNPVFLQELTNLVSHFLWSWDDYLSKYKVIY